ncbi:uncharacterized protein LOC135428730 [Drosophila montana]|uniref:uncharacterized protein LOC135428730 n=1 Tax=Drosophila montana TaxID=40370 RepID=UPI00313E1746
MSDFDDNATGFDLDMQLEYSDQDLALVGTETKQKSEDIPEITQLMKQFAELCLKYTDSDNNCVRQLITYDQNISSKILEEKMQLLCGLNNPVSIKLYTVERVDNMHKHLLQQFYDLFNDENEYVRAYAAHCDQAIKAKEAAAVQNEHDEYTEMPYVRLMECIAKLQNQRTSIHAATTDIVAKYKLRLKERDMIYRSILEETASLEKYELEAM